LFFLGEYCSMILMSALTVIFFFGGWLSPIYSVTIYDPFYPIFWNFLSLVLDYEIIYSEEVVSWIPGEFWFSFKTTIFCFLFIYVRANFPRFRYDQLMVIGWKVFLPFTLAYLIFISGIFVGNLGL
jgi:NADH-quinone oxidoreductase subunit H